MEKRQAAAEAEKHRVAVKEHADAIFSSPRQVMIGNPQGDVTHGRVLRLQLRLSASALMTDMLDVDARPIRKLKLVLKEFPVLGEGSVRPRRSRSRCACRTRPAARSISNSTRSCSAAAARPTRRARWRSRRRSGSTSRGIEKDMASDEVQADARGKLQARRGARHQRHAELRGRQRGRGRRGRA